MRNLDFQTIVDFLVEHDLLKSNQLIPNIKPTHGPCCTCQKCGHYHDECVCEHNEILTDLLALCQEDRI